MMPSEARHEIEAMLTAWALAIVAGTLIAWTASHAFGVGEIADLILLVVGFAALGLSVFSGAKELFAFATDALGAQTEADLDRAAHHFATAVNILGIAVITALLLRQNLRAFRARAPGRVWVKPMANVGPTPAAGLAPRITRVTTMPGNVYGETDYWGNIAINRNQTLDTQRLALYHEWVHSVLSPRMAPLRTLRAQIVATLYGRSALMRYLEEAMAQSYALLRMRGIGSLIEGIRFPVANQYVTISQLAAEGQAIGSIMLGDTEFTVYLMDAEYHEPDEEQ
jgi:hypothetical protein